MAQLKFTLQQLVYALTLRETRHFGHAARILKISQPALSMQLKKLEETLGFKLFQRAKKDFETTERGKLFLDRAASVVSGADQLAAYAEKLKGMESGELRIGIIPTLAPYLVPLFINQLNEKHKGLRVLIKEALTEDIIGQILNSQLDGGIISTPIRSKTSFTSIPLFYEGFKLFVSGDHPLYGRKMIRVEEIKPQDIWVLKEGNCFRDQVRQICDIARNQREKELFHFESNSIESLCRIVEFRGGVTFLPELTTIHLGNDREDMIKDLTGKKQVREISMIHLPQHGREGDLEKLMEIIRANIPSTMLKKGNAETVPTKVRV